MCDLKKRVNAVLGGIPQNQKVTVILHSPQGITRRRIVRAKRASLFIRSQLEPVATGSIGDLLAEITIRCSRHARAHTVWEPPIL